MKWKTEDSTYSMLFSTEKIETRNELHIILIFQKEQNI